MELSLTDNRFPRTLQAPTPFGTTFPSQRGDGPDFEDLEEDNDSVQDSHSAAANTSASLHLYLEDSSSDEDEGCTYLHVKIVESIVSNLILDNDAVNVAAIDHRRPVSPIAGTSSMVVPITSTPIRPSISTKIPSTSWEDLSKLTLDAEPSRTRQAKRPRNHGQYQPQPQALPPPPSFAIPSTSNGSSSQINQGRRSSRLTSTATQASIQIPRFENNYQGRKVHCWFNSSMTVIIFLVKLINMNFGDELMEVDDTAVNLPFEEYFRRWLSLTSSIVVNPIMAILAFSRQFHYEDQSITLEMQDVGQVFQSFLSNPVSGYPGSVHFGFMQPEMIQIQSFAPCPNCGCKRPNTHQDPFAVATVRVPLSLRPDNRDMKKIIEDYFNGVFDRRDGPPAVVSCLPPCQNNQLNVTTKFVISDPKEAIIIYLGNFLLKVKVLNSFKVVSFRKGTIWTPCKEQGY